MNFLLGAWAKFRVEVEDVGPSQGPGWDFFLPKDICLKILLFAICPCLGPLFWRGRVACVAALILWCRAVRGAPLTTVPPPSP